MRLLVDALREFVTEPDCSRWQELVGGLLHKELAETVRAAAMARPDWEQLRECWRLLAGDGTREQITRFFGRQLSPAAIERLHKNACALLASAAAAAASRCLRSDGQDAEAALGHWAARAAAAADPPVPPGDADYGWLDIEPRRAVDKAYERIREDPAAVARAREWTRAWLENDAPRPTLAIPVIGYSGAGFVANLQLWDLDREGGPLVEDPWHALQPLEEALLDAIRHAKGRTDGAAMWALHVPTEQRGDTDRGAKAGRSLLPLDGPSLGAAARVGFELLARKRPYDGDCIILAALGSEEGSLEPVGHIEEKLAAAAARGLHRAVMADDESLQPQWVPEKLVTYKVATVREALDHASGLITGLRNYYEQLVALPDREMRRAAYLERRLPTELNIEPDVLKLEKRVEAEQQKDTPGRFPAPKSSEALDIGEQVYGGRQLESEQRVAWQGECDRLRNGRQRIAVILGPPGQGKSQLVEMTLRRKAQAGLDEIGAGGSSEALPLLVGLTVKELVETKVAAAGESEARLRAALAAKAAALTKNAEVEAYFTSHAHEARAWLFLDGLDEVPEGGRQRLHEYFEVLMGWQTRIVLTSRPYGYSSWQLGSQTQEYRLAPLAPEQVLRFAERWFGSPMPAQQVTEHWTTSETMRRLTESPFLLTLLCWISGRHEVPSDITRSALYAKFVRDLACLRPDGSFHLTRDHDLLPLLAEAALAIFEDGNGKRGVAYDRLLDLIEKSPSQPALLDKSADDMLRLGLTQPQRAKYLVDELCDKRFLTLFGGDNPGYAFPHRSVLEWLTAQGLANQAKTDPSGAFDRALRKAWDPAWEEVILFYAGAMATESPPLLEKFLCTLADADTDDLFRHRLALAARCLAEVPVLLRPPLGPFTNRLAAQVFFFLRNHLLHETSPAITHFGPAIRTLALGGGRVHASSMVDALWRLFDESTTLSQRDYRSFSTIRLTIASAILVIGSSAVTQAAITRLVAMLASCDHNTREDAALIITEMSPATAAPEILSRLLDMIAAIRTEDDADPGRLAADTLESLGRAAAGPDVLHRLLGILQAPMRAGERFIEEVEQLASHSESTEDGVERLFSLISSGLDHYDDLQLVAELEQAGFPTTPNVAARLRNMLEAWEDEYTAQAASYAAQTLGALASTAGAREVLPTLVEMLEHPDEVHVRPPALSALERLREAGATRALLDRLEHAVTAADDELLPYVPALLRSIGEAALTPRVVGWIVETLATPTASLLRETLEALGAIGPTAAKPEVVSAVAQALSYGDDDVRLAAVAALGRFSDTHRFAAMDLVDRLGGEILSTIRVALLRTLIERNDEVVFEAVATTLSAMAEAGLGKTEILSVLVQTLEESESLDTIEAVVKVLTNHLGAIAATKEVIGALAACLSDEIPEKRAGEYPVWVRIKAAAALGEIGVIPRDTPAGRPSLPIPPCTLAAMCGLIRLLVAALRNGDHDVIPVAGRALKGVGAIPDVLARVRQTIRDGDASLRLMGLQVLEETAELQRVFVDALENPDHQVVLNLSRILKDLGAIPDVLEHVRGMVGNANFPVRAAGVEALEVMRDAYSEVQILPLLRELMNDPVDAIRARVVRSLPYAQQQAFEDEIIGLLRKGCLEIDSTTCRMPGALRHCAQVLNGGRIEEVQKIRWAIEAWCEGPQAQELLPYLVKIIQQGDESSGSLISGKKLSPRQRRKRSARRAEAAAELIAMFCGDEPRAFGHIQYEYLELRRIFEKRDGSGNLHWSIRPVVDLAAWPPTQ